MIDDNKMNLNQQKRILKLLKIKSIIEQELNAICTMKDCHHSIGVKTNINFDEDEVWVGDDIICLECNNLFHNATTYNTKPLAIINLYGIRFEHLSIEEKKTLALQLYIEGKEQNPTLSDSEIVENINQKIGAGKVEILDENLNR